tara:strand:- start:469 stop:750 length:282 start_codon:yes stop_codon:yes gene_type:complete
MGEWSASIPPSLSRFPDFNPLGCFQTLETAALPTANRKDKSLSIRFTPEERALLVRLAAGSSLASYIRRRVLEEQVSPRRRSKSVQLYVREVS